VSGNDILAGPGRDPQTQPFASGIPREMQNMARSCQKTISFVNRKASQSSLFEPASPEFSGKYARRYRLLSRSAPWEYEGPAGTASGTSANSVPLTVQT